MSLQLKVIALLIAIVIPLTAAFTIFRLQAAREQQLARGSERLMTRVINRPLPRCQRRPKRFSIERKRFNLYAYDDQFISANPNAIAFPPSLKTQLQQDPETIAFDIIDGHTMTASKHPELDGPCSLILMKGKKRPTTPNNAWRIVMTQVGFFIIALFGTGLLITTPLVRRIRRLTQQVQLAPQNNLTVTADTNARDEIGALARAFNQMGQQVHQTITQLNERDATLKEYISNTTHDLAIPLTVLQHRLRKMQKQAADGQLIQADQLNHAMEESHYIASLIANMSAAAKMEAGREHIKLHSFDLSETIERIGTRHTPLATQKQLELNWATPPEPVEITADSTLLEQAISNLVQNAMQYNDEGEHISIVLDVFDDRFECKILDDGPGIPEEDLPNITERHNRGDENDARTRNPKGQGFGLSIVKQVCALHHYDLHFENIPEAGLMVTISGPLHPTT